MNKSGDYDPAHTKAACDAALTVILDGLDREHYPASLYALLRKVLLPSGGALRATALLTSVAAAWRGLPAVEDNILAAQEMFLRGWLLQAAFVTGQREAGGNCLGQTITAEHPEALVLLAADTLFTLPFEILASQGGSRTVEVVGRFSERFGPSGLLRSLDRAGESLEGFLEENPLATLTSAAVPDLPDDYAFAVLARYCWLREARDWFGLEQPIRCGLAGALDRRDCLGLAEDRPPGCLYAALYRHLGK